MANLETEQMNTNESPMQNLGELGDEEALSKVTGAGASDIAIGAVTGTALGLVGGAVGISIGAAADKKGDGSTGAKIGLGVGAAGGAALGAVGGYKMIRSGRNVPVASGSRPSLFVPAAP
jgi:hypothetical protein